MKRFLYFDNNMKTPSSGFLKDRLSTKDRKTLQLMISAATKPHDIRIALPV